MIAVKKQGSYEVFSRGVEEPWAIWRDGRPYRQVWTWAEVEAILRGDEATTQSSGTAHAKRELQAACDAARTAARLNPTAENRARAQSAWAALEAAIPRKKKAGFASRAGKRQAAERRR
jgi:hypothetical protein